MLHWWQMPADPELTLFFAADRVPPRGRNINYFADDRVSELVYAADRTVDRSERRRLLAAAQQRIAELVPEATDVITQAGGGGFGPGGPGSVSRGNLQLLLVPKDERSRSSEQIAMDLRRQLAGIPGVIVRAFPSGGNNQLQRFLSGGGNGGGRLTLEIRGDDLDESQELAQAAKDMLDTVPGVADARLGRDEGRPVEPHAGVQAPVRRVAEPAGQRGDAVVRERSAPRPSEEVADREHMRHPAGDPQLDGPVELRLPGHVEPGESTRRVARPPAEVEQAVPLRL